jgi:hypothetical protein
LDPYAGLYIHTVKLVWGIPIVMSILWPLTGASSSSSSASTSDQDSFDDYPEIGTSACGELTEGGHLILMMAPNGDQLHNSSSRYPIIRRSEAFDARTPSTDLVRNLNLDFNAIGVQAIMKTIQCMAPDSSPLTILAQHGADVVNLIAAEKSAGIPQREPSAGNNDQASVPEVKLHLQLVQSTVYLSMMRDAVTHRATLSGSVAAIGMTSGMSLKIIGISEPEHYLHHDGT